MRLPRLCAVALFVAYLALSVTTVVRWRNDAQIAMQIVFGPVFALMLTVPGYLAGKGLEFVMVAARRGGLHVEDRVVTVGAPAVALTLMIAIAAGIWMGTGTP